MSRSYPGGDAAIQLTTLLFEHVHSLLNTFYCVFTSDVVVLTLSLQTVCDYDFYRAMHFSAKRGIAIACRLSVCPSVCNVGGLLSHKLEFFEINFIVS